MRDLHHHHLLIIVINTQQLYIFTIKILFRFSFYRSLAFCCVMAKFYIQCIVYDIMYLYIKILTLLYLYKFFKSKNV